MLNPSIVITVKDYLRVKLSLLKSIFCRYTIFHMITRLPRMSKRGWKRRTDERKEKKGIERTNTSFERCFNLRNDRSLRGRAPRDRVDANNRETP